jgi:hypothetical protein
LLIVKYTLNNNRTISGLYVLSLDLKTSKNRIIILSKIQVPNNIIRIIFSRSYRTIFITKKAAEKIRLEKENRKTKLEIRAFRKAETRSGLYKELEKNE